MLNTYWLAFAILVFSPVAALAQQATPSADPADTRATVPAVRYESAFKDYRTVPDEETAPDTVWRSVNETVKGLGEHAGQVKQREQRESAPESMKHGKHH